MSIGELLEMSRRIDALELERDALRAENEKLKLILGMVMQSTLMEANGHDWHACNEPSCMMAREALAALDAGKDEK